MATAMVIATAGGLIAFHPGRREVLPGHDAPSRIVIAPEGEPGQRLVIHGQVFAPDGETAVEGVVLYVYNTGTDGRYAPPGKRVPRLRGWVRTGPEGRYEVETIRPGSYPGGRTAAHVHVFLWGAGYEPQWTGELLFDDDPLVSDLEHQESRAAGRFGNVCTPEEQSDGQLSCVYDIRLKPEGDDFPSDLRHPFQSAGDGEADDRG
jgi:protocatechuate 3,4-dioxygenase beta subunit